MPVLDTRELLGVAFTSGDPKAVAAADAAMAAVSSLARVVAEMEGVTVTTWVHFEDNEAAFSEGSALLDEIDPEA